MRLLRDLSTDLTAKRLADRLDLPYATVNSAIRLLHAERYIRARRYETASKGRPAVTWELTARGKKVDPSIWEQAVKRVDFSLVIQEVEDMPMWKRHTYINAEDARQAVVQFLRQRLRDDE